MTKFAAVLFAVAFAAPAFAQDQQQAATLHIDSGSIMVSTGGDYGTASEGQALAADNMVMVKENSAATLTYGNGCKMQLTQPGTYKVPSSCDAVGMDKGGKASGGNAGIVAGVAAVAGALISNEDNTPNGPLSSGIKHF